MEGVRIDALAAALAATRAHVVPAMKDGATVFLTVGQILDLVIGAAPGQLDTLDELAAALSDDANFSASVTAALAAKANAGDVTAALALKQDKSGLTFSQYRLIKSGGNLLLSREGGRYITINGINEVIPSGGVSLSPSGSTPGTTYNIYAYMTSGVMTLEYSTTGHTTDITTGLEIKNGDATRTLVGMARTVAGPAWVDTTTQRFVISWANRKNIALYNAFTANRTRASTSMDEINSEIRCEFLTWATEAVDAAANSMVSSGGGAGISVYASVAFDTVSDNDAFIETQSISSGYISAIPVRNVKTLSEGYHYATIGGGTSSGTATWVGASAGSRRTQLNVLIRG